MDLQIKTTSFGGYDKKAVEAHIESMQEEHEKEVAELKANIVKLSETVKNLHTMREVNKNESSSAIDNLKNVNNELEAEVTVLREKLAVYQQKEEESANRYESISRTLLEARESADIMLQQTEARCNAQEAEVQARCEQMTNETTATCEQMMNETTEACDQMNTETNESCARLKAETESACQEMKETTYAECAELKRKTIEETDALREQTESECRTLSEQTALECDELRTDAITESEDTKNQARLEAYNVRMSVKRECESVSEFLSQLMVSVDNVVKACDETKAVADQAFPDLAN